MEEEKKVRIKGGENDIDSIIFYLLHKKFKLPLLAVLLLSFVDLSSTVAGIILFITLFLPFLIVKRKLFSSRFAAPLFFIISVVLMGVFFLEADKSFSNVTFLVVVILSIFILSFVSSELPSATRNIEKNKKKISDIGKLVGLCLRSENFILRLTLAFWLFFFAIAFQKTLIMSGELSGDLPLGGLVIILAYIIVFFVSFLLLFHGMISSTKNVDKSLLVKLQFSLLLIIILSIIYLPMMFLAPAYLTPSFGA